MKEKRMARNLLYFPEKKTQLLTLCMCVYMPNSTILIIRLETDCSILDLGGQIPAKFYEKNKET